MNIRKIFFKNENNGIIKSVSVYFSEKHSQIIIAPIFADSIGGYNYEQNECEVIEMSSSNEFIGEAIKRNFDKFSIKENKKDKQKKSDWPSFKASNEKTIIGFEKNYKRFSISGANDYNLILIIESNFNDLSQIELISSISYHCDNSELGKRMKVIFNSEVCNK